MQYFNIYEMVFKKLQRAISYQQSAISYQKFSVTRMFVT